MVELRKRKSPPAAAVAEKSAKRKPGPKSAASKAKDALSSAVESVKDAVTGGSEETGDATPVGANGVESEAQIQANEEGKSAAAAAATAKKEKGPRKGAPVPVTAGGVPKVGDTVDLASFGGEVLTQDGRGVTLATLVEESGSGVVLFTYPKASTPGCTTQACAFRDGHSTLTSTGLAIYGLSSDSPKANTTFKSRQSLPYTLLCDPGHALIGAIGMQQKPGEKKTRRGVFAINKEGKVLLAEMGGPMPTVDAVKRLVDGMGGDVKLGKVSSREEVEEAEVAGEVADTAAGLDK